MTGAGSRLLASRLAGPLTDPEQIRHRQDTIAFFASDTMQREDIRGLLKSAPDMSRALSRLAVDRGGPRDLQSIATAMKSAQEIAGLLASGGAFPQEVAAAVQKLEHAPHALGQKLAQAIAEEPPLLKRDGGFVATGYHPTLMNSKPCAIKAARSLRRCRLIWRKSLASAL